jgi:hypothetical protein
VCEKFEENKQTEKRETKTKRNQEMEIVDDNSKKSEIPESSTSSGGTATGTEGTGGSGGNNGETNPSTTDATVTSSVGNPAATTASTSMTTTTTTAENNLTNPPAGAEAEADPTQNETGQVIELRDPLTRPIFRLSVKLIDTYKYINKVYYEAKARKIREQQGSNRVGFHNDGYDDQNYDYIIHGDEMFAERYILKHRIGKVRALFTS